jgi:D-alanine-D-alanine ligase
MTMTAKHVAVLMGGFDSERPVSLKSGEACARGLEAKGYAVTRVDVGRDIAAVLADLKPDVAFNALHGPYGEGGAIQGVLETLRIPYTHSGILASALAMQKDKAKAVFAAAGIPVAPAVTTTRFEAARGNVMSAPYVVKPVAEGSSFGVIIVREERSHPPQELTRPDWPYGDLVMVERYIPGRELTCAVIGGKATDIIEIVPVGSDFYDYDSKYVPGGSKHVLPAALKPNIYQGIQKMSETAHAALGCRGVSRADFRFDDKGDGEGDLVILEVNTQPGMTETSLVPEMAAHAGLPFPDLVAWMVEDATCDR